MLLIMAGERCDRILRITVTNSEADACVTRTIESIPPLVPTPARSVRSRCQSLRPTGSLLLEIVRRLRRIEEHLGIPEKTYTWRIGTATLRLARGNRGPLSLPRPRARSLNHFPVASVLLSWEKTVQVKARPDKGHWWLVLVT
jgi:hypothetical protein